MRIAGITIPTDYGTGSTGGMTLLCVGSPRSGGIIISTAMASPPHPPPSSKIIIINGTACRLMDYPWEMRWALRRRVVSD